MKRFWIALPLLVALMQGGSAMAAQDVKTQTVTLAVNSLLKLTLGTDTIDFGEVDPDHGPYSAAPFTINAKARVAAASHVTLTVSGTDFAPSISVGQLGISLTGDAGYVTTGLTMSATGVTLGEWDGSGSRNANATLTFTPEWDDEIVGSVTSTLTYTLASL